MANQKKPMGSDSEFVELLWQDGHVVMHSQNHREASAISSELKPVQEPEPAQQCEQSLASSPNLIRDDETVSWFQYPLDDPLEKEFCLGFFSEMAGIDATGPDKMSNNGIAEDEGYVKFGVTNETNVFAASAPCRSTLRAHEKAMTPKPQGCKRQASCLDNSNFSHFSRSVKADFESLRSKLVVKASRSGTKVGGQENSMLTDGSSICGSNRIHRLADLSSDDAGVAGEPNEHAMIWLPSESVQKHACETTLASSSGGSDCSVRRIGEQGESNQSQKRKRRDEDLEYQSEEAEYESAEAKKQQSTSTRRSRAAEVHNLSERRRRDRINEKMKALQELIPRCNKTDKASMLDEAIEYLKSLQLQVQMMWMGSGMAQMMFPGAQQYLSGIGMGMDHASVPLMHHAVHLPGVPVISQSVGSSSTTNQTLLCPSQAIHAVNFRDQMQSFHLQESYAPFLGFHHVQPHSQAMNLCNHGSHVVQQNQPTVTTSSSILSCAGQTSFENSHNSKSG